MPLCVQTVPPFLLPCLLPSLSSSLSLSLSVSLPPSLFLPPSLSLSLYRSFPPFLPGTPDNVKVQNLSVVITETQPAATQQKQSLVSIGCNVTDNSTVPMMGVRFVVNDTAFNYTADINVGNE